MSDLTHSRHSGAPQSGEPGTHEHKPLEYGFRVRPGGRPRNDGRDSPRLASRLRHQVVAEAESWIGTPFHHAARIKGVGVDCLMLLAEVYERAGVTGHIEPPFYVPDWHLHRDAERYMEGLVHYARPVAGPPLPGDIALFRFGRTFSHGAIVTEWPRLVHAYWSIGVVHGEATLYPLDCRSVRFFSPLAEANS